MVFTFGSALFAFVSTVVFFSAPTLGSQVATILSLPLLAAGFIAAAVYAWRHRRTLGWRAMVPVVACLVAYPAGIGLGHASREMDFRSRRLPVYQSAVDRLESGALTADALRQVPPDVAQVAYGVHVHETDSGETTVEFFWGGGFPVKHSVYVYRVSGEPPTASSDGEACRWPVVRRLNDHWFEAHD